jgi:hypothetical protein
MKVVCAEGFNLNIRLISEWGSRFFQCPAPCSSAGNDLQYPLLSVSPVVIFGGLLPAGDYVFCFGVDMSPNAVLDSPLYYDFVQVHVTLDSAEHDNCS